MTQSFNVIANELRHRFRDDLNHAERTRDVENAFALTVRKLLVQALNNSLTFTDNDIRLTPGDGDGYELSAAISASDTFKNAVAQSDLLGLIAQFAEAAAHRHQSLAQHEGKMHTNLHKQH